MKQLFILICFIAFSAVANDKAYERSANNWLDLIDSGDYQASWQDTSDRFKNQVSEAQWQLALEQVRTPLGKVIKRSPLDSTSHTSLPGMPDGTYQVMQFSTQYENKRESIETLSMTLIDGKWQAIGYFIK